MQWMNLQFWNFSRFFLVILVKEKHQSIESLIFLADFKKFRNLLLIFSATVQKTLKISKRETPFFFTKEKSTSSHHLCAIYYAINEIFPLYLSSPFWFLRDIITQLSRWSWSFSIRFHWITELWKFRFLNHEPHLKFSPIRSVIQVQVCLNIDVALLGNRFQNAIRQMAKKWLRIWWNFWKSQIARSRSKCRVVHILAHCSNGKIQRIYWNLPKFWNIWKPDFLNQYGVNFTMFGTIWVSRIFGVSAKDSSSRISEIGESARFRLSFEILKSWFPVQSQSENLKIKFYFWSFCIISHIVTEPLSFFSNFRLISIGHDSVSVFYYL